MAVNFAIVGSGFGLYGYLPALIASRQTVTLPERYRSRLLERDDVRHFEGAVAWHTDESAALDSADAVVLALRPEDQVGRVAECVNRPNIRWLILEKPLGPSPEAAKNVLDLLDVSGKKYRIDYNLRFTSWGADLRRHLQSWRTACRVMIDWQFCAHHYRHDLHNWKRSVPQGGGALRFFGIHLIALLAELGYDAVRSSARSASTPTECETWSAVFAGPRLPECHIWVASNSSRDRFSIERSEGGATERILDIRDPFDINDEGGKLDRRVRILATLCRDLIDGEALSYPWYRQSVRLWEMAEVMMTDSR